MASDYNDGLWHGWSGGECPVHPKSIVQVAVIDPSNPTAGVWTPTKPMTAGEHVWDRPKGHTHIIGFRVAAPYRQPLECWIPIFGNRMGGNYDTEAEASEFTDRSSPTRIALFREVMDGEAQ